MKRIAVVAVLQIVLGSALSVVAFAQLAPSASEIDQSVAAALLELYAHNEAAKVLGTKAKAVLVFPDIKKAAFIVGAQYGFEQGLVGFGASEHVRIGHHFVDLVAFNRVLLQAFNRSLWEKLVNLVDPFGHA